MPKPLLASGLARLPGIAHGFFTRQGGVSRGIYASLNCGAGSKDDPAAVRENRARVAAHLGASNLLSAYQVHGIMLAHHHATRLMRAPDAERRARTAFESLLRSVRVRQPV